MTEKTIEHREDFYNPIINMDQLNKMNKERLEKNNIPEKEIGGVNAEVKPKVETKVVTEPREIPKEDPVPSIPKKEIIKEYNKKPEVKANGVKLISKKTYNILIIALISIFVLFAINMVWENSLINKIANKDFSDNINVNPVNNVNVTDADTIENTYENEYTINNYNNITVLNNITYGGNHTWMSF